ncbi:hypothetical protein K458DRAFT_423238 [Lentithecium fluviatile CBS 122367]|uniref:DUF3128 domain-containing protein n=1 Tax=Lentithecium fluviatile CBS 122367 TaxID=1168545 RepID=A0A6G1IJ92_9PLEO|nr:hypothetical protein K458DRAFT_423238 [Lentithecium fluviatile CBS 122367]
MGWWWSSSGAPPERKAEPQQPTPTSIPIRSAPAPSPQTQAQKDDTDFHAAHPHLGPSSVDSPPAAQEDYDPSLPTTMSCRAAFDSAFYCASLGGHFNDIYRYGQLRSCSEHWADWRFCMTLTNTSAEGKARAIQARYKEKEDKVREKPNSEDVWRKRRPGEEIKNPFAKAEEEAIRVEGA